MAKLKAMLERLIDGEPLPPEYRDHPLRGDFAGSRDCHLEPDWLLFIPSPKKAHTSALSAPAHTAICSADGRDGGSHWPHPAGGPSHAKPNGLQQGHKA